jgi:hypothetical protein
VGEKIEGVTGVSQWVKTEGVTGISQWVKTEGVNGMEYVLRNSLMCCLLEPWRRWFCSLKNTLLDLHSISH